MTAYLINLDSRSDRWEQCQDLPFELVRVSAIANPQGWKGLIDTYHKLFTDLNPTEPILVLEDDCTIVRDIDYYHKAVEQLPAKWDMLLLGANIKQGVKKKAKNLYTVYGAWTTHAVLYHPDFVRFLIPILPTLTIPIDEYFRTQIHPHGGSYCVAPMVAYQRPSQSDIENAYNDYTHLFEDSNRLFKGSYL
jgi:hypothetical protein